MRTALACLLLALLLGLPSLGRGQVCQGLDNQLLPMPSSYEVLTVAASPIALTAAKYTQGGYNAALAQLTVEGAALSYTLDGTAPTSTVGHKLDVGSNANLCGLEAIKAFRAIQVSGASTLKVTYWRAR